MASNHAARPRKLGPRDTLTQPCLVSLISPDGGSGRTRTHSLNQAQAQASTSSKQGPSKHQARITQWVSQRAVRIQDPRRFNNNSALRVWWLVPAQDSIRCALQSSNGCCHRLADEAVERVPNLASAVAGTDPLGAARSGKGWESGNYPYLRDLCYICVALLLSVSRNALMANKDDALTMVRLDSGSVIAEGEVSNERLSMHTTTRKRCPEDC